jgi:hypothetical protein
MNFDGDAILYSGRYHDGDPSSGIPASLISARWMNAVTDELHAILTAAGITPDINISNQILGAIQFLLSVKTDEAYVNQQIANLVNSSPAALDTLNELALALGNDANFSTTINNQLSLKSDTTYVNAQVATKTDETYVNSQISGVVDSAISALNTLGKIATAIGNDSSFSVNINNAINQKADTTYVDSQVASLVDSSPTTLDTLNELANALGDDPNFSTTITNLIGTKITQGDGDARYSQLGHSHSTASLASSGYWRDSDTGFTVQWTTTSSMAASGTYIWTFPTAFLTQCLAVLGNTNATSVFSGSVEINTSIIDRFQGRAVRDGEGGGGTAPAFLLALGN